MKTIFTTPLPMRANHALQETLRIKPRRSGDLHAGHSPKRHLPNLPSIPAQHNLRFGRAGIAFSGQRAFCGLFQVQGHVGAAEQGLGEGQVHVDFGVGHILDFDRGFDADAGVAAVFGKGVPGAALLGQFQFGFLNPAADFPFGGPVAG